MKKVNGITVFLNGTEFLCASFKENDDEALCIYKGNPDEFANEDVIVRIHSGCITSEVFGMDNCDCKWQLDKAIEILASSPVGLIVYLPNHEGKGNGLFNKIRSFELRNTGLLSEDAYEVLGLPSDARKFDFAVQILKDFGVRSVKLITNSPAKIKACEQGGVVVSERIPVVIDKPNKFVRQLLEDKKLHFNHLIH